MEFEEAKEILKESNIRVVEDLDVSAEALKGKPTSRVSKPTEEKPKEMSLNEFGDMFEWYANTKRGTEFLQNFILKHIWVDTVRFPEHNEYSDYTLRKK